MLKVIIDTSCLISFVLTTGDIMKQIIRAWRAGDFVLLTSPQTRAELEIVLARPKIQSRAKAPIKRLKNEVDKLSLHIDGLYTVFDVCRDPKDDMFLACAVEGQAHYLVSSDKDLLDLGQYEGVCILNLGQFLVALRLARLSAEEMKTRFSQETLAAIGNNMCLEPETAVKLNVTRLR